MIRKLLMIAPALMLAGCFTQPPAPSVDRAGASRAAAAAQPAGPGYYTVKRGDTLYRIAIEQGVDYKDLATWNNLSNPGAINEGQVLRVAPPGAEKGGAVVAQPVAVGGGVEVRPLDSSAPATSSAVPPAVPQNAAKREIKGGKEPYSDEAYARLNKNGDGVAKPAETAPAAAVAGAAGAASTPAAVPAAPDDVDWGWPTAAQVSAPYSQASNKGLDFSGKAGEPVVAAAAGKVVYAGSALRGYGELVIVKHNATYLSAYAHNRKILVKEGQSVSKGQKIAEMGNTDADSVKLHFEIRKQSNPVDPAQFLPKR